MNTCSRALRVIALGGLVCAGCKTTQASEKPLPPPGEVWLTPEAVEESKIVVASVATHEVGRILRTSGKMSFDDLHVTHVFSPVEGRVTRIMVDLGQRVKKGDALAVIDSPQIGLASADLEKGFADTVAAEHDYKRQKELYAAGAAPQKDFEAAEDNFRRARAEFERSRQKVLLLPMGEQTVAFVKVGMASEGMIRFERRPVTVDVDEPGDFVPVTRGVSAGESIVDSGALLLSSLSIR